MTRPKRSFATFSLVTLASLGLSTQLGCASRSPSASCVVSAEPQANASVPVVAVAASDAPLDRHSRSNPQQVKTTHGKITLHLDFSRKVIHGDVTWNLERIDPHAPLLLDIAALNIVSVNGYNTKTSTAAVALPFERLAEHPGETPALQIPLPEGIDSVQIVYETSPEAEGLQWLAPEQTAGGKLPFLYTQGQAIFGRSFLPSQDTPSVRISYDASIRVDKKFTAVMSAQALDVQQVENDRVFRYTMPHPIPVYLVAFAAGDLAHADLGPRTGVWADPSKLDAARHEFVDIEAMINAAEALYGPYRWGRYELLVLPPAFPMGGMENPVVTFATPTILAGDRSLVALVAHELAHSWSGNLATNATWGDMWLNEGMTTYAERRIIESIYGKPRAQLELALGRQSLEAELLETANEPQRQLLAATSQGSFDPMETLGDVPYEKGSLFLRRIEGCFGRPDFDIFLRNWFDQHAFQSVTTKDFVAALERDLVVKFPDKWRSCNLDVDTWLHAPGLPSDAPAVENDELSGIDALAGEVGSGARKLDKATVQSWSAIHWMRFLQQLPDNLGVPRMQALDDTFALTNSTNDEIASRWLSLSAINHYQPAQAAIAAFVARVGRRKLVLPIYRGLASSAEGLKVARKLYAVNRSKYHAITKTSIDSLLASTSDGSEQ